MLRSLFLDLNQDPIYTGKWNISNVGEGASQKTHHIENYHVTREGWFRKIVFAFNVKSTRVSTTGIERDMRFWCQSIGTYLSHMLGMVVQFRCRKNLSWSFMLSLFLGGIWKRSEVHMATTSKTTKQIQFSIFLPQI
jgi:hypothetical protein